MLLNSLGNVISVPPEATAKIYGGERVIHALLQGFKILGIPVDLAAPNGSINASGGKLIPTGPPTGTWNRDAEKQAYQSYAALLDQYDVLHDNSHDGFGYLAKYSTNSSVAIVHTMQGISTWKTSPPVSPPNFITHGPWHAQATKQQLGHDSLQCHPCITSHEYPYAETKEDYYLTLGNAAPGKGHIEAILVATRLNLKLKVAIATEMAPDKHHVQFIKDAAAKQDFEVIENPDEAKKKELMVLAKGVILPISVPQSGSLLAIEALACGTECYTSKHSGLADLPTLGMNDLAAGTTRHPNELKHLSLTYDSAVAAKKHLEFYEKAIHGGGWN